MTKAKIGNAVKSVHQLPETNPLRKHLKVLKFKMKCKRLYNKIVRWFKEKHGKSNFECRFTGEETKKFCDGFMHLVIATLDDDNVEKPSNVFPLSLYKMGIHLRCFDSRYCLCGIALNADDQNECKYCRSRLSKAITACATTGTITGEMRKILKHAEHACTL